ncbi:MAG: ABC transporter ATP-binding protein [Vulcanimicrobiaceae bacterium]
MALTPILEAREIYRFYHAEDDEIAALRGVDVSISAGEFVAIIGPSGSGKSTLLACLTGLDDPDGGTVLLEGRRLSRRPAAQRATMRRGVIGIVVAGENLLGPLTVAQNVRSAADFAGRRERGLVAAIVGAVDLHARADARPHELSGGESARAAIAVARAGAPRVIVADEPTASVGGDDDANVVALLRDAARAGTAIVVSTHARAVAAAADRTIVLRDGRIDG